MAPWCPIGKLGTLHHFIYSHRKKLHFSLDFFSHTEWISQKLKTLFWYHRWPPILQTLTKIKWKLLLETRTSFVVIKDRWCKYYKFILYFSWVIIGALLKKGTLKCLINEHVCLLSLDFDSTTYVCLFSSMFVYFSNFFSILFVYYIMFVYHYGQNNVPCKFLLSIF